MTPEERAAEAVGAIRQSIVSAIREAVAAEWHAARQAVRGIAEPLPGSDPVFVAGYQAARQAALEALGALGE